MEIKLDPNFDQKEETFEESKQILEEGFDPKYPIVVDEDGLIIDGNHRYKLFKEAGREDEVEILVIDFDKFYDLIDEEMDNGTIDKFENDDEYFYKRVKEVR